MSEQVSPQDRLRELLTAVVDDRDEAAAEQLGEFLAQHPELQGDYLEFITLHGLLQFELNGTQLAPDLSATTPGSPTLVHPPRSRWIPLTVGVAAAVAAVVLLYLQAAGPPRGARSPSVPPVGMLVDARKAEWSSQSALSSESLPGDDVPPGVMELQSGFAELQIGDGAVLALDGPTQVELSATGVNIRAGRVATRVPPGAKNIDLVHQGLRASLSESHAAMEVCQDGEVFLDVLSGQVDLADQDRTIRLESGQRFHRGPDGQTEVAAASGSRFAMFKRRFESLIRDGGFEELGLVTEHHQPPGFWVGDPVRGVAEDRGVLPSEGAKMARFESTRQKGPHADGSAELVQLVDLSPWAEEIDAGRASILAAACFNRVAGNETTDTKFGIALRARTFTSRRGSEARELAVATERLLTDSDPRTWERVAVPLFLPVGTRAVELVLFASENIHNDVDRPEFDGHYVDDVSLELRLDPGPDS